MVREVGDRARSDADGDREQSHEGAQQRERLSGKADSSDECRTHPSRRPTNEQDPGDHAFRRAGRAMLVPTHENPEMGQCGHHERGGFEEQEESDRSSSVRTNRRLFLSDRPTKVHRCHVGHSSKKNRAVHLSCGRQTSNEGLFISCNRAKPLLELASVSAWKEFAGGDERKAGGGLESRSSDLRSAARGTGRRHGADGPRAPNLLRRVRLDHILARHDIDGIAALVVLTLDPQDAGENHPHLQDRAIRQFVGGPRLGLRLKIDLLCLDLALGHRRYDLDHRCDTFSRGLSAPATPRTGRARNAWGPMRPCILTKLLSISRYIAILWKPSSNIRSHAMPPFTSRASARSTVTSPPSRPST